MICKVPNSNHLIKFISNPSKETQISHFYDTQGTGGFFSTHSTATDVILRLKDGMDASEPSTNGISASNLYRLSSALDEASYAAKAKATVTSFESEALQYPWLFASFTPSIVAGHFGVKGTVVSQGEEKDGDGNKKIKEFEKAPRGALGSFARLDGSSSWLRERNPLLKNFGLDNRTRVLVCENGTCREEGVPADVSHIKETLDVGSIAAALPAKEESNAVKVEDSLVNGKGNEEPLA